MINVKLRQKKGNEIMKVRYILKSNKCMKICDEKFRFAYYIISFTNIQGNLK